MGIRHHKQEHLNHDSEEISNEIETAEPPPVVEEDPIDSHYKYLKEIEAQKRKEVADKIKKGEFPFLIHFSDNIAYWDNSEHIDKKIVDDLQRQSYLVNYVKNPSNNIEQSKEIVIKIDNPFVPSNITPAYNSVHRH